ncbi:MAG: anthranilate synthase component I, partial [Wujia sp.]
MVKPTLEEALSLAGDYKVIPVCKEIFSDIRTPIQVLKILKKASEHCYMLESVENQEKWGRYTFLGYKPKLCVTCMNGHLKVADVNGTVIREEDVTHPADCINEIIAQYKSPRLEGFPSFTGGLVGYFAYDYIKYSEPKLNLDAEDQEGFNDVDLMLFDKVIAFDNVKQKMLIIANAKTDHLADNYRKAVEEISEIIELIRHGEEAHIEPARMTSEYRSLFDKDAFCSMVEKAKRYIYEGDIFQVV